MSRRCIVMSLVACAHPRLPAQHALADDAIARTDVVTLANRERDLYTERYPDDAVSAWLAETPEQFADLWVAVGLKPSPPRVDFARFLVLGERFVTSVCAQEITGAQITADHLITLELAPEYPCAGRSVGGVRVVAVPRSFVGAHFVWGHENGMDSFDTQPAAALATPGRPVLAEVRGVVALPPPGHIALRTLDDGEDVWVAQHREGDISVIDAARSGESISTAVRWLPDAQQFAGGVDSYGRANRDYRLMPIQFERDGESVRIGPDYRDTPAKRSRHEVRGITAFMIRPELRPASTPLELDGPAIPYTRFAATTFEQIADGQLGLVDLDLVFDRPDEARLCRVALGERCPARAPVFAKVYLRSLEVVHGPLLVRRRGAGISYAMQMM